VYYAFCSFKCKKFHFRYYVICINPSVTSCQKDGQITSPPLHVSRTLRPEIHHKPPLVNELSTCHMTSMLNFSVVSLKRSMPTPTSAPRKRPNNSQIPHIPSTFRPASPQPSQSTPLAKSSSYQYSHSTELQAIQGLITAYASRDICLACHISADAQYPEVHSLGRCRSRLAGGQDQTYKNWRQSAFNFEFGLECMGCGISKDASFVVFSIVQILKGFSDLLFRHHRSEDSAAPLGTHGQ